MKSIVNKLLTEKQVDLFRKENMTLPEEKEKLFKRLDAQILEGEIHKVITINLYHEVDELDDKGKIIPGSTDCYEAEEIYRFPYTKNKKLLKQLLNLARKYSHSYFANRV